MPKRKLPKPVTVDFESAAIRQRPHYPPVPVSVSIQWPGKKPQFFSWGHPDGNNCAFSEALAELKRAWSHPDGVLCHNGKFDLDVAEVHCGLPLPAWDRTHETMFLLFLDNPHSYHFGLKEAADDMLGFAPEERNIVADWLVKNQPCPGIKISAGKGPNVKHPAGAYIMFAPGGIVGDYANGDTRRTTALFKHLYPSVCHERKMAAAYDRERKLMSILLASERNGVRVDVPRLRNDIKLYRHWLSVIDGWLRNKFGDQELNIDSGDQLAAALIRTGLGDASLMGLTAKGNIATNKKALAAGVTDPVVAAVLQYRAQLSTCVGTFLEPWLAMAEASGGYIFTTWNQVKAVKGTRTGRLSSTPNFQNMPKEFAALFAHEAAREEDPGRRAKLLKIKCPWGDKLPPLPLCRGYIIPWQEGHILVGRDYCFTGDTEVLTQDGFVRFDQLPRKVKVAQYRDGKVSYAKPKAYQEIPFNGNLVNIIGDRSCDLLVTPSHNCLVHKVTTGEDLFIKAKDYPTRGHKQFHAGNLISGVDYSIELIQFVVALQADATVRPHGAVVWKFQKPRKRERLQGIFQKLNIPYSETPTGDQVTVRVDLKDIPSGVEGLIDLSTKTFNRLAWLGASLASRQEFLFELGQWDGRRVSEDNWCYFSTHIANIELAIEIAAISGRRSVAKWQTLPSGKRFGDVAFRTNAATWTDTYRSIEVPYSGLTYCVSMPWNTIIVRRNGRVMVTGQSQQEPRILAHFEDGALKEQYLANVWIDYHDNAKAHLERIMGRPYQRKSVKNVNLGIIYGQGVPSLAEKNNSSVQETQEIKAAIYKLYPGLKEMYNDMRYRSRANLPIMTWGGREVYCEKPKFVKGRLMTFDYKLVNYLVQGSAADATKEAMIHFIANNFKRMHNRGWKLILQVHDEIVLSVPAEDYEEAQELLRISMESVEFDVPLLSEGAFSALNWSAMKDFDKKGKRVA